MTGLWLSLKVSLEVLRHQAGSGSPCLPPELFTFNYDAPGSQSAADNTGMVLVISKALLPFGV